MSEVIVSSEAGLSPSALHLNSPTLSVESEGDARPLTGKWEDLRGATLKGTKYSLWTELRKTEGLLTSFLANYSISSRAGKLLGRVNAAPTKELKLQSIMLTQSFDAAIKQPTLKEALSTFVTLLADKRATFSTLFPSGNFATGLLKEESKELFLHFARTDALSEAEITSIADHIDGSSLPLTKEDLLKAYTRDAKCQRKTHEKLQEIKTQVDSLEKPGRKVREHRLKAIDILTKNLSIRKKQYDEVTANIKTLGSQELFTDEDIVKLEALSAKQKDLFQKVLQDKEEYNNATDYSLFLNDYVNAIKDDLGEINELKEDFNAFKAPFVEACAGKSSSTILAHNSILEQKTTPLINDVSNPDRLPKLRNFSDLLDHLEAAITEKDEMLAYQLYLELGEYASPIEGKGYRTALEALNEEREDLLAAQAPVDAEAADDAESLNHRELKALNLFIEFFDNSSSIPKSLMLNLIAPLRTN